MLSTELYDNTSPSTTTPLPSAERIPGSDLSGSISVARPQPTIAILNPALGLSDLSRLDFDTNVSRFFDETIGKTQWPPALYSSFFEHAAGKTIMQACLSWFEANRKIIGELLADKAPGSIVYQIMQQAQAAAKNEALRTGTPFDSDAFSTTFFEKWNDPEFRIPQRIQKSLLRHLMVDLSSSDDSIPTSIDPSPHSHDFKHLYDACVKTDATPMACENYFLSCMVQLQPTALINLQSLISLDDFLAYSCVHNPGPKRDPYHFLQHLITQHPEAPWWNEERVHAFGQCMIRDNFMGFDLYDARKIAEIYDMANLSLPSGHPVFRAFSDHLTRGRISRLSSLGLESPDSGSVLDSPSPPVPVTRKPTLCLRIPPRYGYRHQKPAVVTPNPTRAACLSFGDQALRTAEQPPPAELSRTTPSLNS